MIHDGSLYDKYGRYATIATYSATIALSPIIYSPAFALSVRQSVM